MSGVEMSVVGLTNHWLADYLARGLAHLPHGEVSVLLGPSGTGESVFLESLIGLLRPEQGSILSA